MRLLIIYITLQTILTIPSKVECGKNKKDLTRSKTLNYDQITNTIEKIYNSPPKAGKEKSQSHRELLDQWYLFKVLIFNVFNKIITIVLIIGD